MSLRKIFALITMILLVLLIVNLFLPLVDSEYESISLWDAYSSREADLTNFLILGQLIFGIVICILMICNVLKDYKYSLFSVGFILINYIDFYINLNDYIKDYLSFGFYLGIICSIVTMVMVFVGNALSNEKKAKPMMYGQNYGSAPVVGYDPNTGAPIYARPAGFDPNTGAPVYR